jgi:uncharacterized membrane protein YeaQ/YmgE (transglycosylase-associated protein family)
MKRRANLRGQKLPRYSGRFPQIDGTCIRPFKEEKLDIVSLIVSLISGAAGGNIAGALIKKISLGVLGNSVAGVLGGGIGSQILGGLLGGGTSATGGGMLGSVLGSGVGGAVLMVIVGIIKNMLMKR